MEQLIAYQVLIAGKEKERGDCTVEQWEKQRKREIDKRWNGTGYRISVWPPQKWWRRGNNEQA